jgi:DNA-binding beta-propeller fold protein YncE
VLDIPGRKVLKTFPSARQVMGMVLHPDGKTLLVAEGIGNSLALINTETDELERIGGLGQEIHHVAVSPDGGTAYVTARLDGRLVAVDLAGRKVKARLSLAKWPDNIVGSADGRFLYVTARGADQVFVVDAAEWKVLKTFAGHHPHGLAIFPGR